MATVMLGLWRGHKRCDNCLMLLERLLQLLRRRHQPRRRQKPRCAETYSRAMLSGFASGWWPMRHRLRLRPVRSMTVSRQQAGGVRHYTLVSRPWDADTVVMRCLRSDGHGPRLPTPGRLKGCAHWMHARRCMCSGKYPRVSHEPDCERVGSKVCTIFHAPRFVALQDVCPTQLRSSITASAMASSQKSVTPGRTWGHHSNHDTGTGTQRTVQRTSRTAARRGAHSTDPVPMSTMLR